MERRKTERLATTLRALAHPTRLEVLDSVGRKPQSPSEFSDAGPGRSALGTVSHHFRELHRAGLIEVSSTEQRRGALMRSYRLTDSGRQVNRWLRKLG